MSVRCRGTCKNDHTTEVAAPPGRVTWHGPCATDGCGLKVYCRRVPADTPPPPAETRTAEPNPLRVLEVPGYRDEPPAAPASDDDAVDEPARVDAGPAVDEPAGPPARKRTASRRPTAAPAPPVAPAPARAPRPRGVLGRLRVRAAADAVDVDDDRLFGVY